MEGVYCLERGIQGFVPTSEVQKSKPRENVLLAQFQESETTDMNPTGHPRSTGLEAVAPFDEFLADCDDRLQAGLVEAEGLGESLDSPASLQSGRGDLSASVLDTQLQNELSAAVDGLVLLREVLGKDSAAASETSIDGQTQSKKSGPPCDSPNVFRGFEYLRTLGAGSGGWVFLARDLSLPRRVAIKSPRKTKNSDHSVSRALPGAHEAAAIAQLDHPGIVPIHLFDSAAEPPRIVMGYCDGGSLGQWLKAHPGPHDPELAVRVLLDLCDAVGHAHGRNIVHRDLKPGNILLSSLSGTLDVDSTETPPAALLQRWRLKVADFGLAQHLDELPNQDIVGTLPYMSPEQLDPRLGRADVTSDIWSLGAILFELLTGTRPHAGDTIAEVQADIAHHPAPSPQARNRERGQPPIPERLDQITRRCLRSDRSARYASVEELQAELQCFLSGRPRPGAPAAERFWFALRQQGSHLVAASSLATMLLMVALWSISTVPAPSRSLGPNSQGSNLLSPNSLNQPLGTSPSESNTAGTPLQSAVETAFRKQFGQSFVHRTFPHYSPSKLGLLLPIDNLSIEDLGNRSVPALQLQSRGVCLAELTTDPGDDFEFSIAIHQDRWDGNCGIFLGFHLAEEQEIKVPRAQVLRLRKERRGGQHTPLLQRIPGRLPADIDDFWVDKGEFPLDEVWIPALGSEGSPQRLKVVVRGGRITSISWNDQEYPDLISDSSHDWFESNDYGLRGSLGIWSQHSTTFYEPRFQRIAPE